MVNLTSKERFLLEGEKYQHQLAIDKYKDFSIQTGDSKLQSIFSNMLNVEERHLKMINEMLSGRIPSLNNQYIHPYYENNINISNDYINVGNITLNSINTNFNDGDKIICFEALTTEELLHSTCNASSFEFNNTQFKDILNTIVKEKQESLKYLNDYMVSKGMYNNSIFF